MKEEVNFDSLNKFMLLEIFKYLCLEDLINLKTLNRISYRVCSMQTSIARQNSIDFVFEDNYLYKDIRLYRNFNFSNKVKKLGSELLKLNNFSENFSEICDKYSTNNQDYDLIDNLVPITNTNCNIPLFINILGRKPLISLDLVLVDSTQSIINLLNLIKENFKNNLTQNTLKFLKLPLSVFTKENIIIEFSALESLTVKHLHYQTISQNNCEIIYLTSNIYDQPNLTKINLNGVKFMKAGFLNEMENKKIEQIDFRESSSLSLQDMGNFIKKHQDTLISLKLDGENTSLSSLIYLSTLNKLENLYISYCENLGEYIFISIYAICKTLKKLSLRKMRKLNIEQVENFLFNADFKNLKKLDFFDALVLNDNCLTSISINCEKLLYLDISWSTDITNNGIIIIINSLLYLKKLICQGLKRVSDEAINKTLEYYKYEKNFNIKTKFPISAYDSLIFMDFSKCDLINDHVLNKLLKEFSYLNVVNYYSEDLRDGSYHY